MANPVVAPTAATPAPPYNYKAVLQAMVQRGASDLHLKVGRPPTLRVDGAITEQLPSARCWLR